MPTTLVTGCSSGIGYATALHLAQNGHDIYAAMRDVSKGESLQEAASEQGISITPLQLDVNDGASVAVAVATVLRRTGRIDALVNNAGIGRSGPVEETPLQAYSEVMETNFFGALRCIHAVLPHMRRRRSGCIVNVSSIAGRVALPSHSAYDASKWALEALSECLAQEVRAFGIRVVIIEPGHIWTAMWEKRRPQPEKTAYPDARRRMLAIMDGGMPYSSPAEIVAEQIDRAITTDRPRLRYLVGAGAEALWSVRVGMSDDEWLAFAGGDDPSAWERMADKAFENTPRRTDA